MPTSSSSVSRRPRRPRCASARSGRREDRRAAPARASAGSRRTRRTLATAVRSRFIRRVQLVHLADVCRPRAEQVAIASPARRASRRSRSPEVARRRLRSGRTRPRRRRSSTRSSIDRLDAWSQPSTIRGRESLRDQPPHPRVVRRLHVQDPAADQVPERVRATRVPRDAPSRRASPDAGTSARNRRSRSSALTSAYREISQWSVGSWYQTGVRSRSSS